MKFVETILKGAYVITPDIIEDDRGFFARTFCRREFAEMGINSDFVQGNISYNKKKGTLRGMHYQIRPHAEVKLIRCTAGAIYDVIVDLRPESPTFRQWISVELTAANHEMLYIPERFAHGFQTLSDDTEVIYHHSAYYAPENEHRLRFDDSSLGIAWPLPVAVISDRDKNHPLMDDHFQGIQ